MFALFSPTSLPHRLKVSGCTGRKTVSVQSLRKHISCCFSCMNKNTYEGRCWNGAENMWQLCETGRDGKHTGQHQGTHLFSYIHHFHLPPPTPQKGMHTSETKFNFNCPSIATSAQSHLFRAKQASADGTHMQGLQSPGV